MSTTYFDTQTEFDASAVSRQLIVFFAGCFLIPWGFAAFLLTEPEFMVAWLGPVDLREPVYAAMFFFCVWVPSLLGIGLTACYEGKKGLRVLAGRLVKWRTGIYLPAVVLGIPLFYAITDWFLYGVFNLSIGAPDYSHHVYGWIVAAFFGAILLDPGPLGEEIGWRGFATPRLLRILPFWKAELLLGSIWGLWHLPAFFLTGTGQSTLEIGGFMVGAVCLSFLMGSVYVGTGGSVLLAGFIIHYFANQLPDLQNKIWIEAARFLLLAVIFHTLMRKRPVLAG